MEKDKRRSRIGLFITAVLQVTFVAMNTVFISSQKVAPMLVTGFMISLIWTLNVKKAAFGDWTDRIIYATGAMIGTGLGFLIARFISTLI